MKASYSGISAWPAYKCVHVCVYIACVIVCKGIFSSIWSADHWTCVQQLGTCVSAAGQGKISGQTLETPHV